MIEGVSCGELASADGLGFEVVIFLAVARLPPSSRK